MTDINVIKPGDIREAKSGVIIQQVNAQGVMGSGVAKALRDKWPNVFSVYGRAIAECRRTGQNPMGTMSYAEVLQGLFVCNVVGQEFYGKEGKRYTSYDALDDGIACVAHFCNTNGIKDVHFPLIGCGLGGGNWRIVRAILTRHLSNQNLNLWLP